MRLLHAGDDHGRHRPAQANPNPSEDEIRHGLEGNLCRCTGYHNIVKAVQHAARKGEHGHVESGTTGHEKEAADTISGGVGA